MLIGEPICLWSWPINITKDDKRRHRSDVTNTGPGADSLQCTRQSGPDDAHGNSLKGQEIRKMSAFSIACTCAHGLEAGCKCQPTGMLGGWLLCR